MQVVQYSSNTTIPRNNPSVKLNLSKNFRSHLLTDISEHPIPGMKHHRQPKSHHQQLKSFNQEFYSQKYYNNYSK